MRTSLAFGLLGVTVMGCGGEGVESDDSFIGETVPLVQTADARSVVQTAFTGTHSIYGYTVTVKRGARIGGTVAWSTQIKGTIGVFGPYRDAQIWGPSLAQQVNDTFPLSAEATVPQDGTYLVAFKVPQASRPAANTPFQVNLRCEGSAAQCGITETPQGPCVSNEGTVYVDYLSSEAHEFNHCSYVLRANVAPGKLTIHEGARVSGPGALATTTTAASAAITVSGSKQYPVVFSGVAVNAAAATFSATHWTTDAPVYVKDLSAEDSIFSKGNVGVRQKIVMKRSLVENGEFGILLQSTESGLIEDSVIRNNKIGIRIGEGSGYGACTPLSASYPPLYDPAIRYTDIVDNTQYGILVTLDRALIEVEHSNLIRNGQALRINTQRIGAESYIRDSNFFTNTTAPYFESFHTSGALAVQTNYWGTGSGAALSPLWKFCTGVEVDTFGGIASEKVADAGPRRETLTKDIKEKCWMEEDE